MRMRATSKANGDDFYQCPNGFTMGREEATRTPNGNPVQGRWVLRDPAGKMVEVDQYRNDLADRYGFFLA